MVFVKQRRAWASLVPRSVIFTKPLAHDQQKYLAGKKENR